MFPLLTKSFSTVALRPMTQIKTFIFLDLETTGLPSLEGNKTKITELTVLAVQSEYLVLGAVPRVQNKLSMCFNPRKLVSIESENLTGLSNLMLENLAPFSSTTVQMINGFLEHIPKPVCFVAHNGNRFDYPILRAEIEKTGLSLLENVLCVDSLPAFRQLLKEENTEPETTSTDSPDSVPLELQDGFDQMLCQALDEYESDTDPARRGVKRALEVQKVNETTPKKPENVLSVDVVDLALNRQIGTGDCSKRPRSGVSETKLKSNVGSRKKLDFGVSFKLTDVFQRLTNKEIVGAHQAENDVVMLAMCAATLAERFVTWANENALNFADIPVMTPGRKLGT